MSREYPLKHHNVLELSQYLLLSTLLGRVQRYKYERKPKVRTLVTSTLFISSNISESRKEQLMTLHNFDSSFN